MNNGCDCGRCPTCARGTDGPDAPPPATPGVRPVREVANDYARMQVEGPLYGLDAIRHLVAADRRAVIEACLRAADRIESEDDTTDDAIERIRALIPELTHGE